ncbi:MAG: DUF1007 family protein [Rhizobiales bacterium]|nr:DUF1007 family protein [Hyphomicrobiales bacterium]
MTSGFKVLFGIILFSLSSVSAFSHPHVFIEANLEVFRDDAGRAVELRNVWRFDEIFSASIVVDFDENGDNALDVSELENIASTIKTNLKEFDYFTDVRVDGEFVDFKDPKVFLADYDDGKLILIVAMDLKTPQKMIGKSFSVSISDPTYYVAVELADEKSIEVSGGGGGCKTEIVRPDFDVLYAQNPQVFDKAFQGSDDPEIFESDDYLTWVNFDCAKTS